MSFLPRYGTVHFLFLNRTRDEITRSSLLLTLNQRILKQYWQWTQCKVLKIQDSWVIILLQVTLQSCTWAVNWKWITHSHLTGKIIESIIKYGHRENIFKHQNPSQAKTILHLYINSKPFQFLTSNSPSRYSNWDRTSWTLL